MKSKDKRLRPVVRGEATERVQRGADFGSSAKGDRRVALARKAVASVAVVAGGFAYLVCSRRTGGSPFLAAITKFSVWSVVGAVGLGLLQNVSQTTRLWVLLPGVPRPPWLEVFRAFSWGQLVNNFVPARAGDIVKVALIGRETPAPAACVASIPLRASRHGGETSTASLAGTILVADKLADVGSLLVLVAVLAPRWFRQLSLPWTMSLRMTALCFVACLAIATAATVALRISVRARDVTLEVLRGSSRLANVSSLARALAFGTAAWLAESATLMVLSSAMGFHLTPSQAAAALVVLNLGIALPVSFANIGTFEASLTYGLSRFGVATPVGLAIATVHHLVQVACLVILAIGSSRFSRPGRSREFRVREVDKDRTIDYYEGISGNYDATAARGLLKVVRDHERGAVLRLARLDDPSKKSAIDVGCGGGFYALAAKRAGLAVCAVDIAPGMVNQLREKVDAIVVGDLEHLTLASTYDIVLCVGVLDFVLDPAIAFKNLAALLAPGGRLIVHAPRVGLAGWLYRLEKRMVHIEVNLFSLAWFEAEAKKWGLALAAYADPLPTNRVMVFEALGERAHVGTAIATDD